MRWIWNLLGFGAVGLGVVGIALPLLPTTPFLLVAAACFSRGSTHFRAWLLRAPVIGRPLREYLEHRAIHPSVRIRALAVLWSGLAAGLLVARPAPLVAALIAAVGLAVTFYLLRLRTVESQEAMVDAEDCAVRVVRHE